MILICKNWQQMQLAWQSTYTVPTKMIENNKMILLFKSNVFQNKQDVLIMQNIRKMNIIHITENSHQNYKKKKRRRRERRRESYLCWRKLIIVYQKNVNQFLNCFKGSLDNLGTLLLEINDNYSWKQLRNSTFLKARIQNISTL